MIAAVVSRLANETTVRELVADDFWCREALIGRFLDATTLIGRCAMFTRYLDVLGRLNQVI
jgi:hypothetical protein